MSDLIGPALPTKKNSSSTPKEEEIGPSMSSQEIGPVLPHESQEQIGPSIPPHLNPSETNDSYGPQLPLHFRKTSDSSPVELAEDIGPLLPPTQEENDEEEFGPALPPGFSAQSKQTVLGPQFPSGLLTYEEVKESSDEEEDIMIGPLPPSHDSGEQSKEAIARDFEKRSQKMKDRLEGREPTEKLKREEWMTELPPVLQGTLGVGPRQFRARALDIGDRSAWTDTPADKARKSKEKASGKTSAEASSYVAERDARIKEQLKDIKDSSDGRESLLSMHEKKRKRKLKEDEEAGVANVRRPFDRELDLQTNRFDEAAKKRMLKQSAGLSSRFAHGHTSGTFL